MNREPIGAYKSASKTGWAAYSKEGVGWDVDVATGQHLEAERVARNVKNGKPASPIVIKPVEKAAS